MDSQGKVVEKKPGAWKTVVWGWQEVNEHWNYTDGEQVIVEVLSNCPEVELFLNDGSLGVDNGATHNVKTYQTNSVPTHKGRCMMIVQSGLKSGIAKISVKAEGLSQSDVFIEVKN